MGNFTIESAEEQPPKTCPRKKIPQNITAPKQTTLFLIPGQDRTWRFFAIKNQMDATKIPGFEKTRRRIVEPANL
jgi:hypothetical protein